MLVLHFKQSQKRKSSTKDQKCSSVLTGTNKAEKTGEVTVQPASPWEGRTGKQSDKASSHRVSWPAFKLSHTYLGALAERRDFPFQNSQLFSQIRAVFTDRLL